MHADLVKLLDLQSKDAAERPPTRRRISGGGPPNWTMSPARPGARREGPANGADGERRRDELETKIESYRILQDRRRLRLEQVRNPKEASTLMTELDLAHRSWARKRTTGCGVPTRWSSWK